MQERERERERQRAEPAVLRMMPVHEISNNVAFWHVKTQTSLCRLLLRLDTPNFNGVQSVA